MVSDSGFDAEAHLAHGDVLVNDVAHPQFLEVHLKASKTAPFRLGVSVFLGRTESDLCPVAANMGYMVVRGLISWPFLPVCRRQVSN